MRRFYGANEYPQVMRKLRAIYVSHLHADHHIGLIGVLQERRRVLGANADAVLLLAPQQMASWLYFYDRQIEALRHEYRLVPNGDLVSGGNTKVVEFVLICLWCFTVGHTAQRRTHRRHGHRSHPHVSGAPLSALVWHQFRLLRCRIVVRYG